MKNFTFSLLPALFSILFFTSNPSQENHQNEEIKTYDLFELNEDLARKSDQLTGGVYLDISKKTLITLNEDRPQALQLTIPGDEEMITLDLTETQVFEDDFIAKTHGHDGIKTFDYKRGLHYRGNLRGYPNSLVSISVFDDWMMGILSYGNQNYNLGRFEPEHGKFSDNYVLFKERDLINPPDMSCHTVDDGAPIDIPHNMGDPNLQRKMSAAVRSYIEADFKMYTDNNRNEQDVIDYVAALYNEVAILYANEQILTRISEVKVWTMQDPYPAAGSSTILNKFTDDVTSFNGDLAHLFSTRPLNNGGVAWLDVLCSRTRPHAYSNISNNFSPVPTYTFTVEVVTHEMGHNLGSPHTQGCRWGPSRNQALDDCVATEGGCAPGPTPTNGGTIMSYCHLARNVGINFNNGFGQEPGDLIRSKVNNAPCLEDIFDCFSKINLEPGVTYEGSTADGGSTAFVDYSCTGIPHRGAEVAHKFESTVAGRAYITFSETAPEQLNLFMMTECDPAKCDKFWQGSPVPLNDSFDVAPGVEYVFIVDTEEDAAGGDYELRISFPNAACATGAILEAGVMYAGTTRDGTSNVIDYGCSSDRYRGAEFGHAFTATEDGWAYIYFNEEIQEDMDLFILPQCDPASCIKFINGGKDIRDSIPVANGQTYFFFVDVKEDSRGGDYNLLISFPGNGCFTTKTLTNGVTLSGNVTDGASNFINYSCTGAAHGGNEVGHFFISPIAGEAKVEFRDVQNRSLNLFLGKSCNPDSCTQFWSGGTVDDEIQIEALTPYYFIVDKEATGGSGTYELTVTMLPSLDNCFCEDPNTDEICENFEKYDPGPVSSASTCFLGDGQVSDANSFNGDNSLQIDNGSTVLQLGNRLQGKYTIKFKQNVKLTKDAFWRVYHIYDPVNPANNIVAFDVDMRFEFSQNSPFWRLFAGEPFPASSTGSIAYNQELYRDFVVNIDIDNDYAEMFYNGIAVHQWPFSNTPHGTGAPPSLSAIEFFADGGNTEYYIDNFQMIEDDGGFCLNSGALFCDDFDSYPQGASVPGALTGNLWGLMDVPNTDPDPITFSSSTNTRFNNSISGLAAVEIQAGIPGRAWADVVANFGIHSSGKIKKQFKIFVPSGGNAHMNVLHTYNPNGDATDDLIGSYIKFDRTGSGVVIAGGLAYGFNFSTGEWIDFLQLVDFDKDETTVFIQGIPVATYTFSDLLTGPSPDPDLTNVWAGFNFSTYDRAAPGGQDNLTRFSIDNVELFDLSRYLNVDPINVYLPSSSGTETVNVNSNLPMWEAIEDSQWFSTTATGGPNSGSVSISYDANTGIETRTQEILVKGNGAPPKTINVIQDGATPYMDVTPDNSPITCNAIGETLTFNVSANVFWSITSSDDSWLTPNALGGKDDGTFTVECKQNVGGFREDTIVIFGQPAADVVIIVRQDASGPAITTSTDTLCVPGMAGDTTFDIIANVDWNISADSWLTTNLSSGTDNETVAITYTDNPTADTRYGEITMSGGGADAKTLIVKQTAVAPFLESDKLNINLDIPAGTESFTVNSNVDWTLKKTATWFDLDVSAGSGVGDINITYEENTGTVERIDTIRVCGSNGVADIQIIVRQEGAGNILSASPLQITVPAAAGNTTFDITSNITWRAATASVWFDIDGGIEVNDTGSKTITINYQENTSTQTRTDVITITGSGAAPITIEVTQEAAGALLCLDPIELTVDSDADFVDFEVQSTLNNWTISDDVSWLDLNRSSGSGTITVRATYGQNVAPSSRVAVITLSGSGMPDKTLIITQTGAGFSFSTDKQVICFPKNQTSEGFSLTAPGLGWTISDDAAWLQVQPNSGFGNNGNITVIALDNSGNPSRSATITITEIAGNNTLTIEIKQEGDAPAPSLDASPNPIMVTAPAGTNSFDVIANIDWTATSNDSWIINLDPVSGNTDGTVVFDYETNPMPTPRTGTITLSGNGVAPDVTIEVIQEGLALDLSVTPDQLTVPAPMGQTSFRLTSNGDWTTTINDSWITSLTPSSGSATDEDILVEYEENTGTTSRTGTIDVMLTGTNITRTVTITQEATGLFLTTDPQTINVTAPAGTESFSVSSNTNWTYSTNDSWIRLGTSPAGSDSETKNFDYEENTDFNPRTGTITVSAQGLPDQNIVVIQEGAGPILMADQTVFNVSAPAGSESVMVTANVDWGAASPDSWISVLPNSGNGDGMFTITYDENMSSMGRTGTVELSGSQGATTVIITVNQAGAGVTFDVSQTQFDLGRTATVETVDITANVDWTAKTSDSWITVTPTTGMGDATISMAIADNTTTDSRTGTVTICAAGQPDIVITINQDGVAMFVDATPTTINAGQPAGSDVISVTSNTDWTIKTADAWLNLSQSDGSGDAQVTVDYMENSGLDPRVGTITICSPGLDDVVITVNQAGLQGFLMVNPTVINVTSDNGTESFDVMSNVDWEVCDLPSWVSANPVNGSGNGTVVISYSPNMDTAPRSGTIKICAQGLSDAEVIINQEGAAADFLTVTPLVIDVPASPAGSRTFMIESNVDFNVSKDGSSWFQISPQGNLNGNQTITVNYDPNSGNLRSGTITITAAGLPTQEVTVTQEGVNFNLSVDKTDINLTQPMGSNGFEINSNIDWQISDNSGGWISSYNNDSGNGDASISFDYMENTGFTSRSAVITITGQGVPDRTINVTQDGLSANLTVSTNDINVDAPAGMTSFDINSNVSWTITTGGAGWFTVNPPNGMDDATIEINYDANPNATSRSATITVEGGGITEEIVITQGIPISFLTVSPDRIVLTSPSGNDGFEIISNVDWQIDNIPGWISARSSVIGTGSGRFDFDYTENTDPNVRSATLTISGNGLTQEVVIQQEGTVSAYLDLDKGDETVNNTAGTEVYNVSSNVAWTVESDVSWANVINGDGNGDGVFVVQYSANTDASPRVATITARGAGVQDVVVTITQDGFDARLEVSQDVFNVGPFQGTVNFDISANITWSINSNVPWVDLGTSVLGSNNQAVSVFYETNPNPGVRTATLEITGSGLSKTVTIIQSEANSVEDMERLYQLNLFPNPTTDLINVQFDLPSSDLLTIDVIDMTGRIVERVSEDVLPSGKHRLTKQVGNLTSGIYILRFRSKLGVITKRFMVN